MMKKIEDKVKKRVWEKPKVIGQSIKDTFGGDTAFTFEGGNYNNIS